MNRPTERIGVVNCNHGRYFSVTDKKIMPSSPGLVEPARVFHDVDLKVCPVFEFREDHADTNPALDGVMAFLPSEKPPVIACAAQCKWHVMLDERRAKLLAQAANA